MSRKCEPGCTCGRHSAAAIGARITAFRTNNERKKGPRWIEDEDGMPDLAVGPERFGYPCRVSASLYIFHCGPYPRGHLNHHLRSAALREPGAPVPLSQCSTWPSTRS